MVYDSVTNSSVVGCVGEACNEVGQLVSDSSQSIVGQVQQAVNPGTLGAKIQGVAAPLASKVNAVLSGLPFGKAVWAVIISVVIGWLLTTWVQRSKVSTLILTSIFGFMAYLALSYLGIG